MFSGEKGKTVFALGVCLFATIVALVVIVFLPGGKNVTSTLFAPTSFTALASSTLKEVGFSGVLVGFGGFFTLTAYFTAVPSLGGFAGQGTQVAGLYFLQQTFFWPFVFILLLSPASAVPFLFYILPFGIVMGLAGQFTREDLQLSELRDAKSGQLARTWVMASRRFVGASVLVLVILTESFYVVKFNPTLPLFCWVFLLFIVGFAVLQLAFIYGLAFQLTTVKEATITLLTGEIISGYMVSRGEDHILFRTFANERLLIPTSSISKMIVPERKPGAKVETPSTPQLPESSPPALEEKAPPDHPPGADT